MLIYKKSTISGKINGRRIPVSKNQIKRWENGELIQNVMPDLTKDEREFMISGITQEEWYGLFGATK
jgi:uncharacterized protein (DUF779 family)